MQDPVVKVRDYPAQRLPRLTRVQLCDLASSILKKEAFGSWQLTPDQQQYVEVIFMHLRLRDEYRLKQERYSNIVHFYGFLKDGVPNVVHGMPMFPKFYALCAEDYEILLGIMGNNQ